MASSWTHDGFRTAEVARLAGLDAERIRQMVRDGYCQVARVGRYLHFTFAEVVLFRNIPRLLQADLPARRIRDATARLPNSCPPISPFLRSVFLQRMDM